MSIFSNDSTTKKVNIWLPLLLGSILALGMSLGFAIQKTPSMAGGGDASQRIQELIRFVEAKYVDEVDSEELVDDAINSILQELDPHSSYIPAAHLEQVNEELEGEFEGVGIQFVLKKDTIYVVSAISGGPSEKVGIRAGDKIIEIGDSLVAGVKITNNQIIKKLKGERGTTVKIKIKRSGQKKLIPFTITRDKIPLYSVDVSYMLTPTTGYIKINRFSATTHQEFVEQVKEMNEKEGLRNIVIDLRQNPGGYLTAATKILDQLFPDAKLLVYTEGRTYTKSEYKSTGRNLVDIDKVAILIDEGSASASEILAGAIQDWDRGSIIGRRSFGKGLVQEQYLLSDGGALRLTVARYFTPSGRCIQKTYDDRDSYDEETWHRQESGELYSKDSIHISDTTKYYTGKGRVVYGGGGIVPDIFVPLNSVINNDYFVEAAQHVAPFIYEYLDLHRKDFAKYKTFEAFDKGFVVSEDMMANFTAYVKKENLEMNDALYKTCKTDLAELIKANLAKQFFELQGFYKVINKRDKMIEEALKTF